MILLIPITLLICGVIFSTVFKVKHKKMVYSAVDMFLGVLILILLTSINAWFLNINNLSILAIELSLLSFIFVLKIVETRKILFTFGAKMTLIATFILTFILSKSKVTSQIYFVNPDPYGYMSLTGALKHYGNIPNVLSEWTKYTGTNFKFETNWDLPVRLLNSPWLVPDMQIRYAADALNIPRIGLSTLMASIPNTIFSAKFVGVFFIAFIIFSCAAFIGILTDVIYKNQFDSEKYSLMYFKDLKLLSPAIYIFSLVLIGTWLQVMFFEGFAAQITSFTATAALVGVFSKEFIIKEGRINYEVISKIFVIILATYFIYLQQLPIIFVLLTIFILFKLVYDKFKNLIMSLIILGFFMIFGIMSLFLPGTRYLLKQIGGSSGHGSVHLGSPNISDLAGMSFQKFADRIGVPLQEQVSIFPNTLNSGASIPGMKIGYTHYSSSMTSIFLQIFLIAFVIFLIFITFKLNKISNTLFYSISIMCMILLANSFVYVYTHVYIPFKSFLQNSPSESVFSDYVWLRNSALLLLFTLILMACIFSILHEKNKFLISNLSLGISIIIFAFSIYSFSSTASSYKKLGSPSISVDCKILENIKNPIFIWDNNQVSQAALSVNLCNSKVFSLTDPFPAKIEIKNKAMNVIYLQYSKDKKIWDSTLIGSIKSIDPLVTPCDITCLNKLPNFIKLSPTKKLG
jgi:hypothetical protein